MVTDHIFTFYFFLSKLPKVFLFFSFFFFFFFCSFFSRDITEFYRVAKCVTSRCVSFNANYFQLKTVEAWKTQEETLTVPLAVVIVQSCLTLWDPMDCSKSGFPVLHHLPEFALTHVHWVGDAFTFHLPFFNLLSCNLLISFPGSFSLASSSGLLCYGEWGILHLLGFNVQFTQSCPTLCKPMNCSTPGLPVHHQLLEFAKAHVHRGSDAIQPSHPLSSPFPPAPNPSKHQSLFQWVNSSHEVAKVLEFQL